MALDWAAVKKVFFTFFEAEVCGQGMHEQHGILLHGASSVLFSWIFLYAGIQILVGEI